MPRDLQKAVMVLGGGSATAAPIAISARNFSSQAFASRCAAAFSSSSVGVMLPALSRPMDDAPGHTQLLMGVAFSTGKCPGARASIKRIVHTTKRRVLANKRIRSRRHHLDLWSIFGFNVNLAWNR